nr:immunoglobulin heavy chain junction region [Macaca mulatta]MOV48401.1 immunoglobulin heavy chain junction region [Macaca mulatta]MOV48647.1 immunoglobulin heavy chain junction region [Macaca mulatta]MOV48775.1 immunoglobulin heavy chain junction region [Macaca mulatta]
CTTDPPYYYGNDFSDYFEFW